MSHTSTGAVFRNSCLQRAAYLGMIIVSTLLYFEWSAWMLMWCLMVSPLLLYVVRARAVVDVERGTVVVQRAIRTITVPIAEIDVVTVPVIGDVHLKVSDEFAKPRFVGLRRGYVSTGISTRRRGWGAESDPADCSAAVIAAAIDRPLVWYQW